MKRLQWLAFVYVLWSPLAYSQSPATCDSFRKLVNETYNFKPSRLPPAEMDRKSAEMDKIWDLVQLVPQSSAPCLKEALKDPAADPWFLFDGSMLLMRIEPTAESRRTQVRGLNAVDLDDVNLQTWVAMVAERAKEGLDLSEAGAHWLDYPDAAYPVAEYATNVTAAMGALFIFGSMDENIATPALVKIAAEQDHPRRDLVLRLLMKQATAESLAALKQMNAVENPELIPPRAQPKITREEFVQAYQRAIMDDWSALQSLIDKVPDSEKDAVSVLKPADLSLIRQVRRHIIATVNPNAVDYYDSFTQILITMMWK